MGANTGPPKCRTCGKEEWRHICSGIPQKATKTTRQPPKRDRKEYMRKLMADRRAKEA